MTRELDDLILDLRTNESELGTWVFRTEGDPALVLAYDDLLLASTDDWFANEVLHYLKRTLRRLDVTSRSLIAVIEPGSCFAGFAARAGAGRRPVVPAGRGVRGRPIQRRATPSPRRSPSATSTWGR